MSNEQDVEQEEKKELSIEEEIRAAMGPDEDVVAGDEKEDETIGAEPDDKPIDSGSDQEEKKTEPDEKEAEEFLSAPENWDQSRKDAFSGLDSEDARKTYMDTVKSLERGFQTKFDDLATVRKEHETITSLMQPFEAQLQTAGLDRVGGIRVLVGAQQLLTQNPLQGLTQLLQQYGGANAKAIVQEIAKQYGIGVAAEEGQAYQDPEIIALQNQVTSLGQTMQQNETNTQQQRMAEAQNQITLFDKALDDDGNAMHPYFDKVKNKMSQLITSGLADSMESAYDKAVYLDTEIRSELFDAAKNTVAMKLNVDRQQKVDESKRASKNVKTTNKPPENEPAEPDDVRSSVMKTFEALG